MISLAHINSEDDCLRMLPHVYLRGKREKCKTEHLEGEELLQSLCSDSTPANARVSVVMVVEERERGREGGR